MSRKQKQKYLHSLGSHDGIFAKGLPGSITDNQVETGRKEKKESGRV
jgi:hypothetical protein